jgi:hypothetical protein
VLEAPESRAASLVHRLRQAPAPVGLLPAQAAALRSAARAVLAPLLAAPLGPLDPAAQARVRAKAVVLAQALARAAVRQAADRMRDRAVRAAPGLSH